MRLRSHALTLSQSYQNAKPLEVCLTVSEIFPEFDPDSIILTSARNNIGIEELLEEIVESVPPPVQKHEDGKLRCRVVDSWYEVQRGVVCLLKLESGQLKEGDRCERAASEATSLV